MNIRSVLSFCAIALVFAPVVAKGEGGGLRISEVCPCDTTLISNRYETGWVELYNTGDAPVDLANYELARFNRGKKLDASKAVALPTKTVLPGERVVIYANEEFGAAAAELDFGVYFPNKISPKKYPLVCLFKDFELVEKVVIPVDCPDGSSIVCEGMPEEGRGQGEGEEKEITFPAQLTFGEGVMSFDGALTTVESAADKNALTKTDNVWDLSNNNGQQTGVRLKTEGVAQLIANNAYTIDLWFCVAEKTYTKSGNGYGIPIFYARGSSSNAKNGVVFYVTSEGQLGMQPRQTSGSSVTKLMDSNTDFNDGAWHHLVYVGSQLANGRIMVQVDGETLWNSTALTDSPLRTDTPICFGCAYNSTSWAVFKGYIADVKLYAGNNILGSGHDVVEAATPETTETSSLKGGVTRRFQTTHATKGGENDLTDAVAVGPQVSSLYGVKDAADPWVAFLQAKVGEGYAVTLPINPVDAANTNDEIVAVSLLYCADFGEIKETPMEKGELHATDGQRYTATIPAEDLPAAGHLIRWAAKVTDAAGNVWRAPSFNDPDGSYEWFGTIVEPTTDQVSATLQTFHLFGDSATADVAGSGSTSYLMNKQYDAVSGTYPYGARVGVYDSTTGLYYDNVKIDLRGNSTASLKKKSHGVKFNKSQPLSCTDPVTGTVVDSVRRTSWIAEYVDPAYVRQSLSFKAFRDMGNKTPFHYPVRLNINGAFYELAGHSNRFTDELIEDYYKMDPWGYTYKSVGQLNTSLSTTGGGIEKKTPDDGNEKDYTQLRAFVNSFAGTVASVNESTSFSAKPTYSESVTKTVVQKFDLPAWINYLALARITQECDDVWANLCVYYDVNGTDTWMPLAYDLNLSWGAIYNGDVGGHPGAKSNDDSFKCHPFYGGCHIMSNNRGNCGFEAVYQSEKFRRLFLRRLRTAMDRVLQAPGTSKANSPYWQYCELLATNMLADATLDRAAWGCPTSAAMYTWSTSLTPQQGMDDLWENYIVKRRVHLYETHSVTNTAKGIGYAKALAAGIPAAQSPLATLKAGITAEVVTGGVVLRNANAETIDVSGWEVLGPVNMTLPAGTVLDQGTAANPGEVYVVTDRKAYVTDNAAALTDQVIVGNASVGSGEKVGLTAADGTVIIAADRVFEPGSVIEGTFSLPVRLAGSGDYTLQGATFEQGLLLPAGTFTLKNQGGYTNTASIVSGAEASVAFTGKGAFELKGEKTSATLMEVNDLFVSNGVFSVESKATTSNTCAVVVNGNFAVEDKGTVAVKLTKNAATGRGIFMASKDKFCRIGKGGTFTAELNGPGCRALQGDKGSVDLEIKGGATVTGAATGADVRMFKMKGNIRVTGGDLVLTGTGLNTELLSADKAVMISGGSLHLEATDDCVSAAGSIEVSGGEIVGISSGNDVLDSNGTITISDGTLVLLSTAEGHEGLDCDPDTADGAVHTITITGGIVCSLGGKNCDVHLPEPDGQAYKVVDVAAVAGHLAVSAGATTHYFVKPTDGYKVLVSVPALSGTPTVVAALPASVTAVIPDYYAKQGAANQITPGEEVALAATDAAAAATEAAAYVIVLSDEDTAAALSKDVLCVTAEAVVDKSGAVTGYRAVVAVDPTKVAAPLVGGDAAQGIEPIAFEEATVEGRAVSVGVKNAVKGLWYGYEVSKKLTGSFDNDVPSFRRATGTRIKVTGSKRTAASGFFRVKVLPARPTK